MNRYRYAYGLWAARELLKQPGTTLLIALSLLLLATLTTSGLLLSQALTATAKRLLDQGPDLVVRRVTPGGWQPIDAREAATALRIPGIIEARPRIWGTVRAPQGPITVVAANPQAIQQMGDPPTLQPPRPAANQVAYLAQPEAVEPAQCLKTPHEPADRRHEGRPKRPAPGRGNRPDNG